MSLMFLLLITPNAGFLLEYGVEVVYGWVKGCISFTALSWK
jgi:hypothetical protein